MVTGITALDGNFRGANRYYPSFLYFYSIIINIKARMQLHPGFSFPYKILQAKTLYILQPGKNYIAVDPSYPL